MPSPYTCKELGSRPCPICNRLIGILKMDPPNYGWAGTGYLIHAVTCYHNHPNNYPLECPFMGNQTESIIFFELFCLSTEAEYNKNHE